MWPARPVTTGRAENPTIAMRILVSSVAASMGVLMVERSTTSKNVMIIMMKSAVTARSIGARAVPRANRTRWFTERPRGRIG